MGGSSSAQYPAPVLAGLFGANNQNFQPLPYPNTTGAANSAYGGISGFNTNPWASASQGYGASAGLINQGTGATNAANQAYSAAPGLANTAFNSGNQAASIGHDVYNTLWPAGIGALNNINTVSNQVTPYAQQALQQGFDPQQALYNKLFQQQQDQARAENAASGVATTPYGAGLVQQGNQNFDIAWQQAQLANQAQGANTASQLYGTGLNAAQTQAGIGANLYGQGYNALLGGLGAQQAGQGLGANIYSSLYGAGSGALGAGQGAIGAGEQNQLALALANQGASQQQIADYLAYLSQNTSNSAALAGAQNQGFGASNQLYGNQISQSLGQQQLNNQGLSGIGSLLGAGLGFFL